MTPRQFITRIPGPVIASLCLLAVSMFLFVVTGLYWAVALAGIWFVIGVVNGLVVAETQKQPEPPAKVTERIWFGGDDAC